MQKIVEREAVPIPALLPGLVIQYDTVKLAWADLISRLRTDGVPADYPLREECDMFRPTDPEYWMRKLKKGEERKKDMKGKSSSVG